MGKHTCQCIGLVGSRLVLGQSKTVKFSPLKGGSQEISSKTEKIHVQQYTWSVQEHRGKYQKKRVDACHVGRRQSFTINRVFYFSVLVTEYVLQ